MKIYDIAVTDMIDMWGLTSQNQHFIMIDAKVEHLGNFDSLRFLNVCPNLSAKAYSIFASIKKAAVAAGI